MATNHNILHVLLHMLEALTAHSRPGFQGWEFRKRTMTGMGQSVSDLLLPDSQTGGEEGDSVWCAIIPLHL